MINAWYTYATDHNGRVVPSRSGVDQHWYERFRDFGVGVEATMICPTAPLYDESLANQASNLIPGSAGNAWLRVAADFTGSYGINGWVNDPEISDGPASDDPGFISTIDSTRNGSPTEYPVFGDAT